MTCERCPRVVSWRLECVELLYVELEEHIELEEFELERVKL